MIQFYSPDIESEKCLPADESAHCVRVLRMKEGDEIRVTDGRGSVYRCLIDDPSPKGLALRIVEKDTPARQWPFRVTLAVAPTKNADRLEWLVEKAVEIGVDRVVLLDCRRSVRRKMSTQRLKRIAVSAMNQSLKSELPEITDLMPIGEFLKTTAGADCGKYFGYCNEAYERRDFTRCCEAGRDVVIMIGPEGDFSDDEVKMAVEAGYLPVTFGAQRLRTETAALYGLQGVHIINSLKQVF